LERLTRRLQELLGRAPSEAELAHEAGWPAAKLASLRRAMITQCSLDAPQGDGNELSLSETVPDENAGTPYEQLAGDTLRELVQEFIGELGEREAFVLRLRFGLDHGEEHTLQEVANELKLTRERVRQIQEAAIKKLYRWIKKREAVVAACTLNP
jgi:RNA polymerase primary sigma factor